MATRPALKGGFSAFTYSISQYQSQPGWTEDRVPKLCACSLGLTLRNIAQEKKEPARVSFGESWLHYPTVNCPSFPFPNHDLPLSMSDTVAILKSYADKDHWKPSLSENGYKKALQDSSWADVSFLPSFTTGLRK